MHIEPESASGAAPLNSTADSARFRAALGQFDAANAADPNVDTVGERAVPAAWLYGRRMSERLERFAPGAPEPLRLAVRAQHLERWAIPRTDYPEGRKGYHAWRTALAARHAERAGSILRSVGYDDATIARVQALLRKERLKFDADAQTLEDVACLVFLEHYALPFAPKHELEKVVDILRKTWRKMSPRGHEAAGKLTLPDAVRRLVEQALAPAAQAQGPE